MKTCHAIGCQLQCQPRHLFCGKHWRMVPDDVQKDIYRNCWRDEKECKRAVGRAIVYVALREKRLSRETAQLRLARLKEAG